MDVDWHRELIEQLDRHWHHHFLLRLEGLTDHEYFWEPVEGGWSIRAAGDGTFTADWQYPEPSPPPFTTIAWRLGHIGSGVLGMRASNHFGDGAFDMRTVPWPGSAADGVAFVEQAYARAEGRPGRPRRGRAHAPVRVRRCALRGVLLRRAGPPRQPRGDPPRRRSLLPSRSLPCQSPPQPASG